MSHTWIPFFNEWYDKISVYRSRQQDLVEMLAQAGVTSGLVDRSGNPSTAIKLTEIDPFTATNAVLKHGDVTRNQIFSKLAKTLGISSALPSDYDGVPKPDSRNSWYFPYKDKRDSQHINQLWDLFEAVRNDVQVDMLYDTVLSLPSVGQASLTQALFRLNPDRYLPIDSQTKPYLQKLGISAQADTYQAYRKTLDAVKQLGMSFKDASRTAWVEQKRPIEGKMQEGAIKHGYIPVGRPNFFAAKYYGGNTDKEKAAEFDLYMPDGKVYRTDIRKQGQGGRVRSRFSALFKTLNLKPGDPYRISRIGDDKYEMTFSSAYAVTLKDTATESEGGLTISKQVSHPLNQILYGPPGSGKTFATKQIAVEICDGTSYSSRDEVLARYKILRKEERIAFVTFHPSFGYEDFVEGIRLDAASGKLEVRDGIFKEICTRAQKEAGKTQSDAPTEETKKFVLIIDEINRGNISKILGELITLLEPDKRLRLEQDDSSEEVELTLPYSRSSFGIPENVYLVGTMNTADRSIATLDLALRRRFQFIEYPPDIDAIDPQDVEGVNLPALLNSLNQRIEYLLDRDHLLGHAYFIGLTNLTDLQSVFADRIIPLLQEYFFDDWSKIALVLQGTDEQSRFLVSDTELDPAIIFGKQLGVLHLETKKSYRVAERSTWVAADFQELYAHLPGQLIPTSMAKEDEAED